jgi:hypothetical protein
MAKKTKKGEDIWAAEPRTMTLDEIPETVGDFSTTLSGFRSFGTAVLIIKAINDAVNDGHIQRGDKLTVDGLEVILQRYWDNNPSRGLIDVTDPMIAMNGEPHNPFASAEDLILDLQWRLAE